MPEFDEDYSDEDDTMLDTDFFKEEDDDGPCPYCNGRGVIHVEPGSSLTYRCPDCDETEDE